MTNERRIDDLKMSVTNDYRLSSLRFRVRGGSTDDKFVTWLQGEWNCTCFGFVSHASCRHVKAGNVILYKIQEALSLIEKGEMTNWQRM